LQLFNLNDRLSREPVAQDNRTIVIERKASSLGSALGVRQLLVLCDIDRGTHGVGLLLTGRPPGAPNPLISSVMFE
jgi:hypothetical protein